MRRRRLIALANPLEELERPLGLPVQNGRRGSERKDDRIAGTSVDRLLRERQETGCTTGVVERLHLPVHPVVDVIRQLERKAGLARLEGWHEQFAISNRSNRRRFVKRLAGHAARS